MNHYEKVKNIVNNSPWFAYYEQVRQWNVLEQCWTYSYNLKIAIEGKISEIEWEIRELNWSAPHKALLVKGWIEGIIVDPTIAQFVPILSWEIYVGTIQETLQYFEDYWVIDPRTKLTMNMSPTLILEKLYGL